MVADAQKAKLLKLPPVKAQKLKPQAPIRLPEMNSANEYNVRVRVKARARLARTNRAANTLAAVNHTDVATDNEARGESSAVVGGRPTIANTF